jgi:hypothetical protein
LGKFQNDEQVKSQKSQHTGGNQMKNQVLDQDSTGINIYRKRFILTFTAVVSRQIHHLPVPWAALVQKKFVLDFLKMVYAISSTDHQNDGIIMISPTHSALRMTDPGLCRHLP